MIPLNERKALGLILCVAAFVMLSEVRASADANPADLYDLSAILKYEFINYGQSSLPDRGGHWNELSFYPRLRLTSNNIGFAAEGLVRKNFDYNGRTLLTMKEAYADISFNDIDFKFGKQIINWGVTDEIKPTDYFKRYDYTDILRKEEIGILALRAALQKDNVSVELVWAPFFSADKLSYDLNNPWTVVPLQGASVSLNDENKPANNLESSQLGIRAGFRRDGIDYSLVYVYGIDRLPTYFDTQIVGFADNTPLLQIKPFYERIHLFGADWNKSFSTWNFKGEVACVFTEHPEIGPYIRSVLGIDRNFSRFWANTELYVLVQYATDKFLGRGSNLVKTNGVSLNHPFSQALTMNINWKLSEAYSLYVKGIMELDQWGRLVQAELRWKPRDSVTAYIEADYINGLDETYFGMFKNNDRFLAGVRLDF